MLLSDVCLSVAYIGPNSRTQRPRKTKIGTEVAHITRDLDTTFKVKGQLVADVLNSQHARISSVCTCPFTLSVTGGVVTSSGKNCSRAPLLNSKFTCGLTQAHKCKCTM